MAELTPEQVVFSITELVDKIFRFLDTKNLCKARQVCRTWREISNLSLKRRLRVQISWVYTYPICASERIIRLSQHEQDCEYIFEIPHHLCLVVRDVLEEVRRRSCGCCKPEIKRARYRYEILLATVIDQDWLVFVHHLILDRCLTVEEWNAAGCRILKKVPLLSCLKVVGSSSTPAVLPLWCADVMNDGETWNLEFEFLCHVDLHFRITDHGDECEPTRVCLDVFDHCPHLNSLKVMWELEKEMGYVEVVASIGYQDSENNCSFGCSIRDRMSVKISNGCSQAIMKDLVKVLSVAKIGQLTLSLPCHPDLASSIPSSMYAELHSVSLDIETAEEQEQEPVNVNRGVAPAMQNVSANTEF